LRKLICKDYNELSVKAAEIIALQIKNKPDSIIGLATGSTPIGAYQQLIKMKTDFSKVTTFNLDEYCNLEPTHPQSYHYFMNDNLFNHVNINRENINFPDLDCDEYDNRLEALGGTDLQILGIGNNGHIAFIEPGENLPLSTSMVELAKDTITANSRFFEKVEDVPKKAVSMGLRGIFSSKHILLLISGKAKAEIASKLFETPETLSTQIPASLLKLHPNVTVLLAINN
jgi:glucosamine-6-phosphate deaminase